jgi:hypothetical protein
MQVRLNQYVVTPAAGKRLIAKALVRHPDIQAALKSGTIVIIAGTTNGYVAEEMLLSLGQSEGFSRPRFFRGITVPPGTPTTDMGRLPDEREFPGDVVITNGLWQKHKTIFDVVDELKEGDVILKGANAVDIILKKAAVYISHPKGGTIGVALQAVVGRRVRLFIPVGLEKRVVGNLDDLAQRLNTPGAKGPRLLPVPGEIYTEIEAILCLTGATAEAVAGGGVCGAEGSCWLAVSGTSEQLEQVDMLLKSIAQEPPFHF